MKIGLYTDTHYSSFDSPGSARRRTLAPARMNKAYDRFEAEGCGLAICLGDLSDGDATREAERENIRFLASLMDTRLVPTICLMGNHDAFDFTPEEFYALTGEDKRPRDMDIIGKRLIFLDACYFRSGLHYMPGDSDWTDTFYPYADGLPKLLGECREAYIFMHQNIDPDLPDDHCLFNASDIRSVFESDGRVKKVFQGHYHPGHSSIHNGIEYVTLPALCEHEDAYTVIEI